MLADWIIAEHELRGAKGLRVVMVESWVGFGYFNIHCVFQPPRDLGDSFHFTEEDLRFSKGPRVKQVISTEVKI